MSDEMQELLEKIDSNLELHPDKNHVGIVEGRLRNIEELLYELKGFGVIGLFDGTNIQIGNSKDSLEDMVYFFDVNLKRYEMFKSGKLTTGKNHRINYNPETATLLCDSHEIKIRPDSNQSYFLKFVFNKGIGTSISWDEIFEEVVGRLPEENKKIKERKLISDVVRAINYKVQAVLPSVKLLEWRGKSVYRLI